MRATTYSILAAFFSLAPLCQAVDAAAPARPRYYFPREVNRDYGFAAPVEKRAPQVDPGTTLVIVPVTVYVGPDGKPFTLGGQRPTPTVDGSAPEASAAPADKEDPGNSPDPNPMGKINIGQPNPVAPSPASDAPFAEGAPTGFPAQTQGFPTIELPGLGTPFAPPAGGTGATTSDSSKSTTAVETEPTQGPILTLPPLFPSADPSTLPPLFPSADPSTLPPLFPSADPSSAPGTNSSTNSTATSTRSDLTDLIPLPTLNLPTLDLPTLTLPPLITPTPTPTPTPSMPVTSAPGNSTDGGDVTLPPLPSITVFPPDPTQNSTSIVIPTPSTTPSGVFPNPTDIPTGHIPTSNSTIVTPPPTTSTPYQTPPTSTPPPPPATSTEPEKPISTDSLTSMLIPTSIVFEPTPAPPNPSQTNKPPTVPNIISPDLGIPKQPADSRLIQIGFNRSLTYEFVVSNRDSNVQIFSFTPMGVAFGLQIPANRVLMHSIQRYNAPQKRTYTTALALIYIPANLVEELSVSLHNPYSLIYQNPDPSIAQLMSMIDPSIPLIPGGGPLSQDTFGPGGSGGGGGDTTGRPGGGKGGDGSQGGDDEAEGPGGSGGSSNVKATSVGIGLGVVGGAALYGAAMFFVARRYRKKRKQHRRTSSLTSGMGEFGAVAAVAPANPIASDALMTGGRTDGYTSPTPYTVRDSQGSSTGSGSGSGRNQMISAPVMAENSLGWN